MGNRFWNSPMVVPIALLSVLVVVVTFLFHRPAVSVAKQHVTQGEQKKIALATPTPTVRMHVIRKGDTLTKLTKRYCGTLDAMEGVIRSNRIANPHRIYVNQVLTFTGRCASSPEQVKKESASPGKFANVGEASQEKRISKSVPGSLRFRAELLARLNLADPDCLYVEHKGMWKANTLARVACIRKNYGETIERSATERKLPVNLLYAIIHQESWGRPDAISSTGCKGIMQFESRTARGYGVSDVFDPFVSIPKGAQVLSDYLRFWKNDLDRGIASYNHGPGGVQELLRQGHDTSMLPYVVEVKKVLRLLNESGMNS